MKKYLRHALLLALALTMLFGATGSWGQSIVTGGVAGTVTDPTGAVVSGADVTLKSASTGAQFKATTSSSGDYVISLVKPGDYTLEIAKAGFKTAARNVAGLLGTTVSGNAALEVGSGTTTVEVSAENVAQLQTENANISTSFRDQTNPGSAEPGRRRHLCGANRARRHHEQYRWRWIRQFQHFRFARHLQSFHHERQ